MVCSSEAGVLEMTSLLLFLIGVIVIVFDGSI